MLNALIADDDPVIISILERLLSKESFSVTACSDGNTALKIITQSPFPDLAILDWNMPGLTGLEVSNKQEETESTSTYKILLSGEVGKLQMLEALHNGFHDILLKPLDRNLFTTRITVAKKIITEKKSMKEMNDVINIYAQKMEQLAGDRAKQLVHADRMSSLGVMYAGISHVINNPMSFISGNAQHIRTMWKIVEPVIHAFVKENPNNNNIDALTTICDEMPKIIGSIMNGVERISSIVKRLKRFSAKQSIEKSVFDLNECVNQAIELNKYNLNSMTVNKELSNQKLLVDGNSVEIEQVITNIIINAVHATESLKDSLLQISTKINADKAEIIFIDNGPGINEDIQMKIWDPFFTTKPVGKGTGLGLSVSAGIIRDHAGTISALNNENGGAKFIISLPLNNKN